MRRLRRSDVPIATDAFARFAIGLLIVRRFDDGSTAIGRIVETEAYAPEDPASHAFRGRTSRNQSMFGINFAAYVYFIYGSAYCLNITTEPIGIGAAVLIRALEPLDGLASMRTRRGPQVTDRDLLRGPGRICRAFEIDRRLDGVDLESDDRLWLARDSATTAVVGISTRIGLTKAVEIRHRFFARGSSFLSGPRALSQDS